jgi:hypothetical protein
MEGKGIPLSKNSMKNTFILLVLEPHAVYECLDDGMGIDALLTFRILIYILSVKRNDK